MRTVTSDATAAVLVAATLAGVIAASRALLPKDPVASAIAALLVVLAPPFRGSGTASLLAACGAVWAVAGGLAFARAGNRRWLVVAVAGGAAVAGTIVWHLASRALDPSLTAMVAATGQGAAAVVVGAGLLGAAFGAATGLGRAGVVLAAIAAAAVHAIAIDPQPAPLLALLGIGCAVIPSAVARLLPERRTLAALLAGATLVAAALVTGAW